MEIRCDATIPFPRELVWTTYRDRLPELLPYMPNIRAIEVKERKDDDGVVELLNVWHGGGDIPAIARAFLSENMLSWSDYATWTDASWECAWRVVPHSFAQGVTSQGVNRYVESNGKTMLQIRGDLTIDGSKIRGVPRLLAGKVSRTVEEFMVKLVSKNLQEVSVSLSRFLEADSKK